MLISYLIHKTCTSNYVLIFVGELSSSSPIPTLNSLVYTLPALVLTPLPAFVLRLTLAFSRFTGYASTREKGKISLSKEMFAGVARVNQAYTTTNSFEERIYNKIYPFLAREIA